MAPQQLGKLRFLTSVNKSPMSEDTNWALSDLKAREVCKNPKIDANTYTTVDGMVITDVALITEFTVFCDSRKKDYVLIADKKGRQIPALRSSDSSKYQGTYYGPWVSTEFVAAATNGSAEDAIKNAGAGAFSSAFSISYPVGKCDNFDGDIAAISFVIDKLESCSKRIAVFFIDSQAIILSLINSRYNENALVHSSRMKLIELGMSRESIAIQWIPSRCNIAGNEKAGSCVQT
ncbi:uncharacterized protein TNCV_379461 [Trichonephila clavipes]|nr:uncharacterized protein TNCV_379461 [Trichonephila clavipes]